MNSICKCGHGRNEHVHYRPGSDCGYCGAAKCHKYRPSRTRGLGHEVLLRIRRFGRH